MKSANNEYYDAWLPIYINETNFEYNKQTILNSFSILKYGNSGKEEYDFKPKYIFEILFKLFNQMTTNIKDNKISIAYLIAFFQYILLYQKLSKLYYDDMNEYFNKDLFYDNDIYSTICDIIFFTLFDKFSFIENQLIKLKEVKKNKKAFELFYEKEGCDLKSPKKFLQYLEDNNLYNNIAKSMQFEKSLFLYDGKNIDKKIKKIICSSFKKFINNSDMNTREKVKKIILENTNFYEHIEFEKYFNNELNDESNTERRKDILTSLVILLYIKKKINEKNFMNELENNFGVYLKIDEIIKELKGIISNIDIYFDKEVWNFDKIRVKKLIDEIINLDDGTIEAKEKIIDSIKISYEEIKRINLNSIDYFSSSSLVDNILYSLNNSSNDSFDIDNYTIDEEFLFIKIISMKIDNLKLLYLYCYERLEKSINRKNNKLSLIESMFIEISLNDNVDENCEWYNFICEKQKYDNKNKKKFNYNEFISENKNFISNFHKLIRLNEKLLLDDGKIMDYMIFSEVSEYIIGFAEYIFNKQFEPFSTRKSKVSFLSNFFFNIISINKIKEIFNTRDITLLTFYELILLELVKKIDYGFLSALETQFLYDLQMKDSIKKLSERQSPKMNRINKKVKRLIKKKNNKIFKLKRNIKDIFGVMKLSLWKTRAPIKTKKFNFYKYNN